MFVALIAATVLMADAGVSAPANPPAPAAAQPAKKAEDKQMVCKTEQVLGSRLPVKKCRTVEQAAQEKQDAHDQLDRAQGAMANNPR
jgi:hypothetical protein